MNRRQHASTGRNADGRRERDAPVRRGLEAYADEVVEAELEVASDRLEVSGSLTPETTEAISRLATKIAEDILAPPRAALEGSSGSAVRDAVTDLFELGPVRELGQDWETRSDGEPIDR